jgi:TonB family protein
MTASVRLSTSCAIALAVLAAAPPARAQDSLTSARDLYASAAYEDALTVLDRLRASNPRADDGRAIDQYRAFCLLALGRASDAARAIEAVVSAAPSYHPSDAEVSPRVRSAFTDVRRRMLPAIVQQKYAEAKGAFDQKQFAAAAGGFAQVLELLADPDLAAAAAQPPLADLRMLAAGFHDLSAKSAAPPPLPPPLPPPAPAEPPPPPRPIPHHIYSAEDADVTPPVTVRQVLPPYPGPVVPSGRGVLEIIVDEAGEVEAATMRMPVNALYDKLAVAAAKAWRFKPAALNGVPVKFRKSIQITLKSTT